MSVVTAIWCGPYPAELPDGRVLQPGDSAQIDEANLTSAHWQLPEAPKAPKPKETS